MGLSSKQVSNDLSHHPTTLLLQSQTLDLPSMTTPPPPPPPTATKRQLHHQEQLKCPRCESTNTKFCYYNNYNKSQPRHFCKTCKRHWTKGGTLRNVPIGGGRKNKRHKRYNNKPIAAAKVTTAPVTSGGSVKNAICNNTQMEIQSKNLASFPILNQFAISSITDVGFDSNSSTVTSVPHQDLQTLVQIPCSEKLTSFDTNPSLISTYPMEYPFGISGTTVMANTRSVGDGSVATVQQPWQVSSSTSSYLNWDIDDFDTFVSSSNLNIPWDDYYDIKP